MKTAEEWVEHLGMGVWASDILEIQRDAWEAATKAQLEKDVRDCFPIANPETAIRVHGLTSAPFPEGK